MKLDKEYINKTKIMLIESGENKIRLEILKQELPELIKDLDIFKETTYSNEVFGSGNKTGIDDLLINRENKIESIETDIKKLERMINRVYSYINRLDNDYKKVIELRYINIKKFGKFTTFEHIANDMNLAETTVKRYNSKAICQLTRLIYGEKAINHSIKIDIK